MTSTNDRLPALIGYDALVLTASLWFLAKFLRYAIPALFPIYRVDFAVSNALLGAAFTAMMLVYSVMQFPSGAFADRLGAVRIIAAGAVTTAVGALILAGTSSFTVLLGGMVLVGLGTGTHKTVSVGLLSRIYPAHTGRALGLFDAVGGLGGVVAPLAVVVATDAASWHALFLVGALAAVGLAWGVFERVARADPTRDSTSGDVGGLRRYVTLFGNRRFKLFVGVTLCVGFSFTGVAAFLPSYLVDRGLTTGQASLLYSALFAVSLVQVVTGDLSDRVGRLPVAAVLLAVAAVALGSLVALGRGNPALLGVAIVAFGLGSHGFRPIRGAYLTAVIPDDVSGGGLGLVRTLLQAVSALAPAIVGALADMAGFALAFGVLASVMACGSALVAVLALPNRD